MIPVIYAFTTLAAMTLGVPWPGLLYVCTLPGVAILPLSILYLRQSWSQVLTGGSVACIGLFTCSLCMLGGLAALVFYPLGDSPLLSLSYGGVHILVFACVLAVE